jgi:stage V sporulation protein D (sporulation-specific penicillin-binding protein)
MIRDNFSYKFFFVSVFLFSFFFFLIIKLYQIQILNHEHYVEKASRQYSGIDYDLNRGKIYFSKKNEKSDLAADTIEQIKEFEKNGEIQKQKENIRVYPHNNLAAKVIGFVGFDNDIRRGLYGVERYYNDILMRENEMFWTNLFAEVFRDTPANFIKENPETEGDIVLTIDVEVQKFLLKTLQNVQSEWKADEIGAIIMSPKDGRIYAMEQLPSYDLNNFRKVENSKLYNNNLVSGVYEVGSILKPLTVAAALDSGVANLNTFYNDTGERTLNNKTIRNFDGVARGYVNIQEILDQSLNIGILFLVEKMGVEKFSEYFSSFGFTEETGIDLPSETAGLSKNLGSGVFVNNATIGFGQGIAISPIQTITALAALGNGGRVVNPYIVDSIHYSDGDVKKIIPNNGQQVFQNKDTSENISRMLVHVVDEALLHGKYKRSDYSIAAKTGTAQIADGQGGYFKDKYLHSFFGYFPAYDPEYIIYIYHVNPKGAEYASQTLTAPFFDITQFLITYYGVTPDR